MATGTIKILYVADNLSFGGGERGFAQLATGLNRDSFQPHIAANPGGELEDTAKSENIPFFPLNMKRQINFATVNALSDIIRKHEIDIVHTMGARADFFGRMACRQHSSVTLVCTTAMLTENFDVGFLKRLIYTVADKYSTRYVTHFIAVSKALKKTLVQKRHIADNRISVVYNGVELEQYDPATHAPDNDPAFPDIPDDHIVVGTIGRLVWQKGFLHFLDAARLIHDQKPDTHFVIVGEGEEEQQLRAKADSLGLAGACTFAGLRHDIPRILAAFDVFAFSSLLEGLPRTIIEAMAMARPIVATNIDGVREQLEHNRTGLIVPPANPTALAAAVLDLLNNREKASALGKAARKDAEEHFDLKHTLTSMESLYRTLASSEPSNG